MGQPVFEQPMYQQPVFEQPMYQQPVFEQHVYHQPMYQQPVYEQPIYQQFEQPSFEYAPEPEHKHGDRLCSKSGNAGIGDHSWPVTVDKRNADGSYDVKLDHSPGLIWKSSYLTEPPCTVELVAAETTTAAHADEETTTAAPADEETTTAAPADEETTTAAP